MKWLGIVATVLGAIGLGIGVYHLVETWPNVKAFQEMDDTMLWVAYRSAAWVQVYSMWAAGGLGLIAGAVAFLRNKSKLGLAGGLASIAAIVISLTTIMAGRM